MNVFEDLLGELKEENLLEDTVVGPAAAVDDDDVDPDGRYHAQLHTSEQPTGDDYHRKRAAEEVAAMQMVEHVLAGVEREHYRAILSPYDDLEAKKALHRFQQVADEPSSPMYNEAETALLAETRAWSAALYERDGSISLQNMRAFCENCRPVLSSQALLALSRFYRNGPFTEERRQKFEFVMTRLFSRATEDNKRKLLFDRTEMTGHIRNLYAKWSSLSMLEAGEEETAVEAVVKSFTDCGQRARSSESLSEVIESGLLQNLQSLKSSTNELFFVPEVVSAAMECNVRVGNRLLELARETESRRLLEEELAAGTEEFSESISQAVSRTLGASELLEFSEETAEVDPGGVDAPKEVAYQPTAPTFADASPTAPRKVNRWLVYVTVLVLLASGGLYFWADRADAPDGSMTQAAKVDLNSTELGTYLRTGRATDTTFYAVTLPAWDQLSDQQKKDVIQKSLSLAGKLKLNRVELLNYKGRTVGFGTPDKIQLVEP